MTESLRIFLDRLIDYAGLFPPAGLPMEDAVRNYERYRRSGHAFALGRFVVPADRIGEVPDDFPISVVGLTNAAPADAVLEVKAASAEDVDRIGEAAGKRAVRADRRTTYVETNDLGLLGRIAHRGLRAKIRTGGVTPAAFPAAGDVAQFMRACRDAGVAFKATAGLHHPVRCLGPLTYEPNAPTGTMHGFVNVFLAAAMLDHADEVLREEDPSAFSFDDDGVRWRDTRVSKEHLAGVRQSFAISFGSCSFEEPIADLQELGWL
jgi:hypothetical protein